MDATWLAGAYTPLTSTDSTVDQLTLKFSTTKPSLSSRTLCGMYWIPNSGGARPASGRSDVIPFCATKLLAVWVGSGAHTQTQMSAVAERSVETLDAPRVLSPGKVHQQNGQLVGVLRVSSSRVKLERGGAAGRSEVLIEIDQDWFSKLDVGVQ